MNSDIEGTIAETHTTASPPVNSFKYTIAQSLKHEGLQRPKYFSFLSHLWAFQMSLIELLWVTTLILPNLIESLKHDLFESSWRDLVESLRRDFVESFLLILVEPFKRELVESVRRNLVESLTRDLVTLPLRLEKIFL